ncbi:MAG: cyanoexosortase A system-associated protein, partial [Chroococcales cyanobacterium]
KWQLTETQDLEIDNKTYVAKKYQYQLGLNQVIVKLKYLKDGQGDNIKLLQASKSIDLSNSDVEILDIAGVGYTGVFTHQGTAYLSSCLNPQGGATFTAEQFAKNRNTLDVQFNRVLPWIFGLHDLRDWRCLWVTFSTPVHSDNPQQTYALLKQVWQEWYVESDWEEVF